MKNCFGLIYKAINLNNRKVYIGQTVQLLCNRVAKHKQRAFKNERKSRSERIKGNRHPCATPVKVNGKVFDYIKEAAEFFNMVPSTLYARLRYYKKRNNFPEGWGYVADQD